MQFKLVLFILFCFVAFCAPAPRLVKDPNHDEVYFIIDGKRNWIQNPTSLYNLVDTWDRVSIIPNTGIYPVGPRIDVNAQLVKRADQVQIYLVQYGVKRWVKTAEIFESLGLSWAKVVVLPPLILKKIKNGPEIL